MSYPLGISNHGLHTPANSGDFAIFSAVQAGLSDLVRNNNIGFRVSRVNNVIFIYLSKVVQNALDWVEQISIWHMPKQSCRSSPTRSDTNKGVPTTHFTVKLEEMYCIFDSISFSELYFYSKTCYLEHSILQKYRVYMK